MKLYLVERKRGVPGVKYTVDQTYGVVVRARDPQEARRLASGYAMDEGKDAWLKSKYSTCRTINTFGRATVILVDQMAV